MPLSGAAIGILAVSAVAVIGLVLGLGLGLGLKSNGSDDDGHGGSDHGHSSSCDPSTLTTLPNVSFCVCGNYPVYSSETYVPDQTGDGKVDDKDYHKMCIFGCSLPMGNGGMHGSDCANAPAGTPEVAASHFGEYTCTDLTENPVKCDDGGHGHVGGGGGHAGGDHTSDGDDMDMGGSGMHGDGMGSGNMDSEDTNNDDANGGNTTMGSDHTGMDSGGNT